ncbi:MAG: MBL fold metallo-hydrolase [Cystobacterineae bacterium]|nr:MBL fold metallo-hydrolase [Cystobacterineae bacterium]
MHKKLYIRQLPVGPMANFVYLVGAADSEEAVLMDASWEAERIMEAAQEDKKRLTAIVLTHVHYDHVQALPKLVELLKIPVFLQQAEMDFLQAWSQGPLSPSFCPQFCALLKTSPETFQAVQGDARIALAGVEMQMLLTPGHTVGGQCILVQQALFTGDILFVGACGRVDLPGGDVQQLYKSLNEKLKVLPAETLIFPGHDYGEAPVSSLEKELKSNPYLQDKAGFFSLRT